MPGVANIGQRARPPSCPAVAVPSPGRRPRVATANPSTLPLSRANTCEPDEVKAVYRASAAKLWWVGYEGSVPSADGKGPQLPAADVPSCYVAALPLCCHTGIVTSRHAFEPLHRSAGPPGSLSPSASTGQRPTGAAAQGVSTRRAWNALVLRVCNTQGYVRCVTLGCMHVRHVCEWVATPLTACRARLLRQCGHEGPTHYRTTA